MILMGGGNSNNSRRIYTLLDLGCNSLFILFFFFQKKTNEKETSLRQQYIDLTHKKMHLHL
jgi:hypothetical protein